ncbi:MAG: CpsD/CapB family tyrosine-protein kinase [Bradymonadaceae bacterium]
MDTDLRKPRLHKAMGLEKEPGISSAITGDREVLDLVQQTPVDNLNLLASGEVPPNPSELLHSERFEEIFDELSNRFDRLIFDSPPLIAVSDALILSQLIDGVLLILEFGKTRRETFGRSLEQLRGIGAPFLGCVINEVAANGAGYYGYNYSYYQYSYYGDEEDKPRRTEDPDRLAS